MEVSQTEGGMDSELSQNPNVTTITEKLQTEPSQNLDVTMKTENLQTELSQNPVVNMKTEPYSMNSLSSACLEDNAVTIPGEAGDATVFNPEDTKVTLSVSVVEDNPLTVPGMTGDVTVCNLQNTEVKSAVSVVEDNPLTVPGMTGDVAVSDLQDTEIKSTVLGDENNPLTPGRLGDAIIETSSIPGVEVNRLNMPGFARDVTACTELNLISGVEENPIMTGDDTLCYEHDTKVATTESGMEAFQSATTKITNVKNSKLDDEKCGPDTENNLLPLEQLPKSSMCLLGSQFVQEQQQHVKNKVQEGDGIYDEKLVEMESHDKEKNAKPKRNRRKKSTTSSEAFLSIDNNIKSVDFSASLNSVVSSASSRIPQSTTSLVDQTAADHSLSDTSSAQEQQNYVSTKRSARRRRQRRKKVGQTVEQADTSGDCQEQEFNHKVRMGDSELPLDNEQSFSQHLGFGPKQDEHSTPVGSGMKEQSNKNMFFKLPEPLNNPGSAISASRNRMKRDAGNKQDLLEDGITNKVFNQRAPVSRSSIRNNKDQNLDRDVVLDRDKNPRKKISNLAEDNLSPSRCLDWSGHVTEEDRALSKEQPILSKGQLRRRRQKQKQLENAETVKLNPPQSTNEDSRQNRIIGQSNSLGESKRLTVTVSQTNQRKVVCDGAKKTSNKEESISSKDNKKKQQKQKLKNPCSVDLKTVNLNKPPSSNIDATRESQSLAVGTAVQRKIFYDHDDAKKTSSDAGKNSSQEYKKKKQKQKLKNLDTVDLNRSQSSDIESTGKGKRSTISPANQRENICGDVKKTGGDEGNIPQKTKIINCSAQANRNPTEFKTEPVYEKERNRYSLLKQGLLHSDNVPQSSFKKKDDHTMGQGKKTVQSDGAEVGANNHRANRQKNSQQNVDEDNKRIESPVGAPGRRLGRPAGANDRRVESPKGADGRRVNSPKGADGRRVESHLNAHDRRVVCPMNAPDRSLNSEQGLSSPNRTQGHVTPSRNGGHSERRNQGDQTGGRHRQGPDRDRGRQTPDKRQDKKTVFMKHWTMDMVSQGLKKGFLVEGTIRVNPKNYEDAYIPSQDGKSDLYISGFDNRNRAMNGDTVAVLVNHHSEWRVHEDSLDQYEEQVLQQMRNLNVNQDSEADVVIVSEETEILENNQSDLSSAASNPISQSDCASDKTLTQGSSKTNKPVNNSMQKGAGNRTPLSTSRYTSVKDVLNQSGCNSVAQGDDQPHANPKYVQQTGKVVAITEMKHSRACSGHIKPMDRNRNHALFCSTDHRCPRIMIPMSDCPADFLERPNDHSNTLFIARITNWPDTSKFAHGNLARSLGEAGLIEPETEAMLIEYNIDHEEFSPEALESLPKGSPWVIPPEEYASRKDFRTHCIFTIDPATARDLDDALSCEDLGNGLYEVGVHIADVSYFIKELTALDTVASQRATSVYLVQKVIPMLPRLLCEELCSLNPNKDRLTFSVIWHMTQDGQIQGEWFGRSVIRSCVKLSYDHAQGFIENPEKEFDVSELPPISEGFSVGQIRERVLNFHKIAKNLRKKRFDNGALRLDQVKLAFSLDKDSGLPNGYSVYSQRDSNRLVEEFMLLANMAVGHKILRAYPEQALLRRHPPPQSKMFDDLHELCDSLGVPVDTSSAGALQRSLDEYAGVDQFSKARCQVLVSLCSKPMQNARYFCAGMIDDEEIYHHYALNVPVYTHFTSPIRRYPDVIVHRLLAASLGYCEPPSLSSAQVDKQADHCNDKKLAAKYVSERSSDVFFAVFIKEVGPMEEPAMVMAVLDRAFDVFVLKLGVIKRVYCEKLPLDTFSFRKDHKKPILTLVWSPTETNPAPVTQEISIFTMVMAILQSDGGPLKWSASVYHPGGK